MCSLNACCASQQTCSYWQLSKATLFRCVTYFDIVFQEDAVFVGTQRERLVWNMGKRSLGIIDTSLALSGKGGDLSSQMTVLHGYTENSIVRKMVGCRQTNRVCILEISDSEDKNFTDINCFDIDIQRTVFSKKLGADDLPGINRFTKSIELSVNEEYLFSVGVLIDSTAGESYLVQKGFINAMKLNATLKECSSLEIDQASHADKKGMYRVNRMADRDTLIVSSWVDVFVYSYSGKTNQFSHQHSFISLHTNLIYNVICTGEGFFTCSNDCENTFIRL